MMFNAVLDTNILVSGLLSAKGNPARIINAFRDKQFNLFYNAEIVAEYRDVLFRNRLGLRVEDINALLESIYIFGFPVIPYKSNQSLSDEDDRIFYDVAKTANAYLITGNIKHYPDEPFIITPAQFAALLEIP